MNMILPVPIYYLVEPERFGYGEYDKGLLFIFLNQISLLGVETGQ